MAGMLAPSLRTSPMSSWESLRLRFLFRGPGGTPMPGERRARPCRCGHCAQAPSARCHRCSTCSLPLARTAVAGWISRMAGRAGAGPSHGAGLPNLALLFAFIPGGVQHRDSTSLSCRRYSCATPRRVPAGLRPGPALLRRASPSGRADPGRWTEPPSAGRSLLRYRACILGRALLLSPAVAIGLPHAIGIAMASFCHRESELTPPWLARSVGAVGSGRWREGGQCPGRSHVKSKTWPFSSIRSRLVDFCMIL